MDSPKYTKGDVVWLSQFRDSRQPQRGIIQAVVNDGPSQWYGSRGVAKYSCQDVKFKRKIHCAAAAEMFDTEKEAMLAAGDLLKKDIQERKKSLKRMQANILAQTRRLETLENMLLNIPDPVPHVPRDPQVGDIVWISSLKSSQHPEDGLRSGEVLQLDFNDDIGRTYTCQMLNENTTATFTKDMVFLQEVNAWDEVHAQWKRIEKERSQGYKDKLTECASSKAHLDKTATTLQTIKTMLQKSRS